MTKKPIRKIEWTVYCLAIVSLTLLIYLFLNRNQTSVVVEEELSKTKDKVVAYNAQSGSYSTKSDTSGEDLSSIFNDKSADVTKASSPEQEVKPVDDANQVGDTGMKNNPPSPTPSPTPTVQATPASPNPAPASQNNNLATPSGNKKLPALASNAYAAANADTTPLDDAKSTAYASASDKPAYKTPCTTCSRKKTVKSNHKSKYVHKKRYASASYKQRMYPNNHKRTHYVAGKKSYVNPKTYNWTVLNRYEGKPDPNLSKVGSYKVKPGDNIWKIGQKLHKKDINILAANPSLQDPDALYAGQILAITNK